MAETRAIYHAKVYVDGFTCIYPECFNPAFSTPPPKKRKSEDYKRNNKISEAGTFLNHKAKRKIRSVLSYRFYKLRNNRSNRMKFFTFTIQADHYHEIKKMSSEPEADQFYIKELSKLMEVKMKYGIFDGYTWVAEKTKQGVIHFHAVIETSFIDAKKLSTDWANRCGFVDHQNSVHYGFEDNGFYKKTKVESIKQLSKYLTKYLSKGTIKKDEKGNVIESQKVYGRTYAMSRNYSQCFEKSYVTIYGIDWDLDNHKLIHATKEAFRGIAYTDKFGKDFWFSIKYLNYQHTLICYFKDLWKLAYKPVQLEIKEKSYIIT